MSLIIYYTKKEKENEFLPERKKRRDAILISQRRENESLH